MVVLPGREPILDSVPLVRGLGAGQMPDLGILKTDEVELEHRGGQRLEADTLAGQDRLVAEGVGVGHPCSLAVRPG